MDRHDRPQSASDHHLTRPSSSARGPSPVPSHRSSRSNIPVTPGLDAAAGSDYFTPLAAGHSNATSVRSQVSNPYRSRAAAGVFDHSDGLESLRRPSIRIRRLSGASSGRPISNASAERIAPPLQSFNHDGNRPRSISQPERAQLPPEHTSYPRHSRRLQELAMPRLTEEGNRPTMEELRQEGQGAPLSPATSLPERSPYDKPAEEAHHGHQRRFLPSRRLWPGFGRKQDRQGAAALDPQQQADAEYDEALVDWLDTIDPEVQTLSTLTNVQNSLFVPDLGSWINRRPTYTLSQHQLDQHVPRPALPHGAAQARTRRSTVDQTQLAVVDESAVLEDNLQRSDEPASGLQRSATITSQLTDSHYAALPHGQSLEGWTEEEKWELDDHVRHMLHSRRSRMKRRMKGFGQYVSRPLGFLVTLYAVLITLFGLAWVLFMIGWIYVGDRQKYIIHVVDSVLVALFAIMGDGLAPFRAMDTYRLFFIVRYTRIIERAKKGKFPRARSRLQKQNIPPKVRESMDMMAAGRVSLSQAPGLSANPRRTSGEESAAEFPQLEDDQHQLRDLEDGKSDATDDWLSVLTPKQQKRLLHHKKKMAKSHSFYKPQETFTHRAFPLSYLIAIVLLLDLHSCLQISLGATTWGIDYRTRNPAITTTILCLSITANITAGLTISRGDRISRKKDVVKLLDRQALTGDAIKHLEKKRKGESGEDTDLSRDPSGSKLDQRTDSPDSGELGSGKLKKKNSPGRKKTAEADEVELPLRMQA